MHAAIKSLFPDVQSADYRIQDDSDGKGVYFALWAREEPVPSVADLLAWVPPAPVFDSTAAKARLKLTRRPILDALSGLAGRLERKGMAADALAADAAAEALLALTSAPPDDLAAATSDTMYDYLAHEHYKAIARSCPPTVVSAFKEVA